MEEFESGRCRCDGGKSYIFGHEGYWYQFEKFSKSDPQMKLYRCEFYKFKKCSARMHEKNEEWTVIKEHAYGPNQPQLDAQKHR